MAMAMATWYGTCARFAVLTSKFRCKDVGAFFKFVHIMQVSDGDSKQHVISEGKATVKTAGNVFYNPVQEFNRDLR